MPPRHPVFTAVRTTHAMGDGCRLTFAQGLQARAKASATNSFARWRLTPLAATARRQLSLFVRRSRRTRPAGLAHPPYARAPRSTCHARQETITRSQSSRSSPDRRA